jgi:hypothetical protein
MSHRPPAFIFGGPPPPQAHWQGQFPAHGGVPPGGYGGAPTRPLAIHQQPPPSSTNGESSFNEYGILSSYTRILERVTYPTEVLAANKGKTLTDLPQSVLLKIVGYFENLAAYDINRLTKVNKYLNLTFSPMLNQHGLRRAAWRSNIGLLKQCLKADANPNWPFWTETNAMIFEKPPLGAALQEAAHKGSIKVLTALLDAGAEVNSRDCCGDTALHRAVAGGHLGAVLLLVKRGARLDILDIHDFTSFDVAIENVRMKAAYCFLRIGYNPNRAIEPTGSTALHKAVDANCEYLVTVLLTFGTDINATDWCGATPLIRGIRKRKSLGVIKVLLEQLPNLEIRDRHQRNALFYVIESRDRRLAELFSRYYAGQNVNRLIKEAQEDFVRWNERDQRTFVRTYPGA